MKRLLATLVALSLVVSMFTGVFASVPDVMAAGPPTVNLLSAANFVILSKAGITNVPTSHIIGNVGTTPISGASILGLTCPEVTGTIYTVDAAGPACRVVDLTLLNTARIDMEAAYVDASTRTPGTGATNLNVGGGTLNGQNFAPGTYTWNSTSSNVTITGNVTLSGTAADIWIFQIAGTLDVAAGVNILLSGGAVPQNIFWQVADVVTLLPGSHFEGNILALTKIAMQNGASINGRLLAQTEVTLIANTIGGPISANRPGSISIFKDTVPDSSRDFSFTIADGLYMSSTFSLDDDADPALSNTRFFQGLLPGTYTITEAPVAGYTLTGIAGVPSFDLSTRTAIVTLTVNMPSATVAFTNTGEPDIHLVKSVSPTGAVFPGTRLTYTLGFSNTGTAATSPDTRVTDVLDGWLDETTLSNISGWGGSYNHSNRTITWTVGSIAAGGSWGVTFSVNIRSVLDMFLIVYNTGLYGATTGGTGHSNTVETPVLPIVLGPEEPPVVVPPPPSIAINVTAPDPLCVEAYLPYQVCFTNGVPPYKYTVDFGDGTPVITGTTSSSCVTLEHAYLELRQYTFSVTVHDSKGMESTHTETFMPVDCTEKVVVYHHNFFIGYPDGTFQPDGNVTRAEVAAAMSRALGLGWTTEPSGFSDLKATHWAAGFITLMTQEGFMTGDPDGRFRADEPMTREEAAAAFLRIAGMSPVLNPSSSSFKDVQPMSWSAGYIEAARTAGLLAGYPDNTFRPADLLSRAEFATLASNALGRVLTTTNTRVNPQYEVKWPDVPADFWAYNYILEVSTPHTVTNPTRLTRIITLKDRRIPLFSEGDNGTITFLHLGDTITAIVPVDGLQPDGSDPVQRQVKVRILNHERP